MKNLTAIKSKYKRNQVVIPYLLQATTNFILMDVVN